MSATAWRTASGSSQRNVVFAVVPSRRPVRPIRCMNDDTVLGAFAWKTLSRIAHVDAKLQRGRADDAGVRPVGEPLFGGLAFLQGNRAVVDEHVNRPAPHPLRDGLRQGPRLAEEQALLPGRPSRRFAGKSRRRSRAAR